MSSFSVRIFFKGCFFCIVFLGITLLGCNKHLSPLDSAKNSSSALEDSLMFPVGVAVIAYPDDASFIVPNIELTWDQAENRRRIAATPGFDTLTREEQEKLIKVLLSTVPDSILNTKPVGFVKPLIGEDTCITRKLAASECTQVMKAYHVECPAGLVFDADKCFCHWPETAPKDATNWYTYFQFEMDDNDYASLRNGKWSLTAAFGYPKWCEGVGYTLRL